MCDTIRCGEPGCDGQDHADGLLAVELELVVATRGTNHVGNFEDGLESDSLLPDIPFSSIRCCFLGPLSNPCQGLELCEVEPDFIAVGAQVVPTVFRVKASGTA